MATKDVDDWEFLPSGQSPSDGVDDWEFLDERKTTKFDRAGEPQRVSFKPDPKVDAVEAAMRGGAQGIMLDHADEATAGVGAAMDVLGGHVPTGRPMSRPGVKGFLEDTGDQLANAYKSRIGPIRERDALAQEEQPWSYGGAQAAGVLGSTIAGPAAVFAPVKGGGALANIGRIAAGGAVQGEGQSKEPLLSLDTAENAAMGAGIGLGTAGLMKGAGAAMRQMTPTNVAKKGANVFLNTPEEITDLYIKDPQKVREAPRRFEVVQKFRDLIDKLQNEVNSGSAQSRQILRSEGKTTRAGDIAKVFQSQADEIEARSEGIMGDDPQKLAAYKWLRAMQETFEANADKQLSTNRVKDLVQSFDRQTDWETGVGRYSRIDDAVKKSVRRQIDATLKADSPAYADQMQRVSADTELLGDASKLAQNEGAMSNILRRTQTDQYGGGRVPARTLESFDERMGSDILDQAKYAHAREAFDKSITNGSRNVNLFSNMLREIPGVKHIAPIIGGSVDKYGRQMTMSAVDKAAALNKIWQSSGWQVFARAIDPVVQAAQKSEPSAILTLQLLEQLNPDAASAARGNK